MPYTCSSGSDNRLVAVHLISSSFKATTRKDVHICLHNRCSFDCKLRARGRCVDESLGLYVSCIFIYGSSLRSHLLRVICWAPISRIAGPSFALCSSVRL